MTPDLPRVTFEFATAARILFGSGSIDRVGGVVKEFGRGVLLVAGARAERAAPVRERLAAAGCRVEVFAVPGEPATTDVERGVEFARGAGCDVVVGFGGGSAIDAAKAISALLTNGRPIGDYLEVVGRGLPLEHPAAPCIAIPTTAGTGAEVTRNAVLGVASHCVKVSLRSPLMLPRVALVDPGLTFSLPRELTATTGLDALTQLIEPYVSSRANPLVDALCVEGLRRVGRSLRRAADVGHDAAAREDMSLASLFGGLALANAGLGAVHGFAGPIGGAFPAPHGAVCAALLPHVVEVNARALRERAPSSPALARYDEIARILTRRPHAAVQELVGWISALVQDLQIPPLRAHGLTAAAAAELIPAAQKASSMKANPLPLTDAECSEVFVRAL